MFRNVLVALFALAVIAIGSARTVQFVLALRHGDQAQDTRIDELEDQLRDLRFSFGFCTATIWPAPSWRKSLPRRLRAFRISIAFDSIRRQENRRGGDSHPLRSQHRVAQFVRGDACVTACLAFAANRAAALSTATTASFNDVSRRRT